MAAAGLRDRVLPPDRASVVEPDLGGRDDGRRQGVNSRSSARLTRRPGTSTDDETPSAGCAELRGDPRHLCGRIRPDPRGGGSLRRGSHATEGARGKSAARAIPAAASACAAGGTSRPSADASNRNARASSCRADTGRYVSARAGRRPAARGLRTITRDHRVRGSACPVRAAGSPGASGGSAIQGRQVPRLGLLPSRRHPGIGRRRSWPDHVRHDRAVPDALFVLVDRGAARASGQPSKPRG